MKPEDGWRRRSNQFTLELNSFTFQDRLKLEFLCKRRFRVFCPRLDGGGGAASRVGLRRFLIAASIKQLCKYKTTVSKDDLVG